jgi:hypothetical protein
MPIGHENGGLAQLARAPALHAGGQRFESVILHHQDALIRRIRIGENIHTIEGLLHGKPSTLTSTGGHKFFDVGKRVRRKQSIAALFTGYAPSPSLSQESEDIEVTKGTRGMPWLSEAMKDVISCDKLGGGAHTR